MECDKIDPMMYIYIFIGFLIGRRIFPLKKSRYIKWWYRRKGIPFFICNILDGNVLDNSQVVKVGKQFYIYESKKYYLYDETKKEHYTPYITIDGENNVFHLKDNINPLVVGESGIKPAYNDPSVFASFINNKTLQNTLHPEMGDIAQIKRFVLIGNLLVIAIISMVIYYFISNLPGG